MAIATPAPRVLADYAARTALAQIALVLGGATFVGIAAQIAIPLPFTPVPLTLQTFAVLLVGAALGSLRGVLSMVVYLAVGMVGFPWFAEGTSGFSKASFGEYSLKKPLMTMWAYPCTVKLRLGSVQLISVPTGLCSEFGDKLN